MFDNRARVNRSADGGEGGGGTADIQSAAFRDFTMTPIAAKGAVDGLSSISKGGYRGDPRAARVDGLLGSLLDHAKSTSEQAFELEWKGQYSLSGLKILGHTVGYARDGMMQSTDGGMIGFYERIISGGGEQRDHQKVKIILEPGLEPKKA